MKKYLPLGHNFIPPYGEGEYGSEYTRGTGCSYIIRGNEWTGSDPIRCRKSIEKHAPISFVEYYIRNFKRYLRNKLYRLIKRLEDE